MSSINHQIGRLFDELMRSQFMSRSEIDALQQRHLANITAFSQRAVPFYRRRLAPVISKTGKFDFARWHEIPIFDRVVARQQFAEMQTDAAPDFAGPAIEQSTSGSTGRVLRLMRSNLAADFDIAFTQRAYTWWRLNPRAIQGVIITIADLNSGFLSPDGRPAWHFGDSSGRTFAFQASAPVADQLRFLCDRRVNYLLTYPSTLEALVDHAIGIGADMRLEAVMTVGETLSQDLRDRAGRAFGARVFDTYGCIEIGNVAAECPACGHYHVNAEAALLEVLDERDRPVGPGESGRAILTSLYNYAMPFIRYEVGDRVTLTTHDNRCGRGLPSIAVVNGRESELFVTRDGELFYPAVQARIVAQYIDTLDVQFVQTDYERLEIRYVPGNRGIENRFAELAALAESQLGRGMKVSFVPVPDLPRPRGAKPITNISLVRRPLRP